MSLGRALRGESYPCKYPFKLVCQPEAVPAVRAAFAAQLPPEEPPALAQRASRNGRYIAVTVTIEAHSAEQIEAIYAALTDVPGIVTSL